MKTISISNQKGGCAKTTTAINLSGALASLGKKVLVIDLDPQAHATFGLGMANSQAMDTSIYNVLTENPAKRRAVYDCIVGICQNVDLIPSNILLSTLEQELKDREDAVSKLYNVISMNKLSYDYLVIDCPPSLGFLTFNALRAADLIFVPIDMSAFSLMGVGKLLGMLELIKLKIAHAPMVKALATIFDKRTKYSQTMLSEIKTFFKDQMLESVIRTNVALKRAAMAGVPVTKLDKTSNGAIDHISLAREVLKVSGDTESESAISEVEKAIENVLNSVPPQSPVFINSADAKEASSDVTPARVEKRMKEMAFVVKTPAQAPLAQVNYNERTFSLKMPEAKDVYIVGEFNNWKIGNETKLSKLADGTWQARLNLQPGKYRYKFVVDGQWILDSQNQEKEYNQYGTLDSVIKV
jgi:chromosome partitioning protein